MTVTTVKLKFSQEKVRYRSYQVRRLFAWHPYSRVFRKRAELYPCVHVRHLWEHVQVAVHGPSDFSNFPYELLSTKRVTFYFVFEKVNKPFEREIMVRDSINCRSYPSLSCSLNVRFKRRSIYFVENMI